MADLSQEPPTKKSKFNPEGDDVFVSPVRPSGPTEEDLGIRCRLNSVRFNGVLKERFNDFQVNEVDPQGNVVEYTSSVPPAAAPTVTTEPDEERGLLGLQELLPLDDMNTFKEFLVSNAADCLFSSDTDKKHRTAVHQVIKNNWPHLSSETAPGSCVRVVRKKQELQVTRGNWVGGRPKHLLFVLVKENKDTTDVINMISRQLRLKANRFGTAGTKDKRAVTSQRVTVKAITAERMNTVKIPGVAFGNYQYVAHPLRLGELTGNRFGITIRDVNATNDELELAVTSVKDKGFINYFGTQRFGTSSVATHHIGILLLQSRWQEAVDLILGPRAGDTGDAAESRKRWAESRNAQQVLYDMPRFMTIERLILRHLAEEGRSKDYLGAMTSLPRNTRLLYVHAYQSYVWNQMASLRHELYGTSAAVVGDLVYLEDQTEGDKEAVARTKILTEADVNQYTIDDVILPLPGTHVSYPAHEVGAAYQNLMGRDNIDLSHAHKTKSFALPGSYRKVLQRPTDVQWRIVSYSENGTDLAASVMNRITNSPFLQPVEGTLRALQIHFTLPSAAYATMFLRELMGMSTTKHHHSEQSKKLKAASKRTASEVADEDGDRDAGTEGRAVGNYGEEEESAAVEFEDDGEE